MTIPVRDPQPDRKPTITVKAPVVTDDSLGLVHGSDLSENLYVDAGYVSSDYVGNQ